VVPLQYSSLEPLVVDLDGTLTPTDTLYESLFQLARQDPRVLLRLPSWLAGGRAYFKSELARRQSLAADSLPYCESLVEYLRQEKARGRRIILATAANRQIADSIARHLGLFELVLASDESVNLKGECKRQAIVEAVGQRFVYAGDCAADLPIWKGASAAVLVGVTAAVARQVRSSTPIEREFARPRAGLRGWLRAVRVHQWLKNLLLFIPLLTAFAFSNLDKLGSLAIAFLAFSLTASATYLANDLLDLNSDRAHPRKRYRPLACALVSLPAAMVAAVALLLGGLGLGFAVSGSFLLVLLLYLAVTFAYSWVLKEYVLIDVLVLSLLYTIRILAGSVAVGISLSEWLLAFSVFLFLSLALIKRCSELVVLERSGKASSQGRDYRVGDLTVFWPLGVSAAMSAVVVFGLFISAAETRARYASPLLLWLVAVGLMYWLGRLWIKTSRGEMHDDPVIYAIKDRGSRVTVLAMVASMLCARFISVAGTP